VCDKSAAHSLHANIMLSFYFPVVIGVNKWLQLRLINVNIAIDKVIIHLKRAL